MVTKLLPIKKDNSITIYGLSYEEEKLTKYFKFLSAFYDSDEKSIIESTVMNGKLLSMGKFDYMKRYCKVDENYRIINILEDIDANTKRVRVEINVKFFSMIIESFKEVFMTDGILINTTEFFRLRNHLLNKENNFTFNAILDLYEKNKEWNDPYRLITSRKDVENYIAYKMRNINVDRVKLNKKDNDTAFEKINVIIKELNSMFKIEQIGLYPIQENLSNLQNILKIFGERNEELGNFYGILEDVYINNDGGKILDGMTEEICNTYNMNNQEETIKNKINYYSKRTPFLQF